MDRAEAIRSKSCTYCQYQGIPECGAYLCYRNYKANEPRECREENCPLDIDEEFVVFPVSELWEMIGEKVKAEIRLKKIKRKK